MANGLQHCAACREEYVAGVAACVECGAPLQPGPLDRSPQAARRVAETGTAAMPDRLLAELPGAAADQAVRALLLEGIACGAVCDGIEKVYLPDKPPTEPFAVSLPVSLYVADAQYEQAQEILASCQQEDVIGDQWSSAAEEAVDEPVPAGDAEEEPADDAAALRAEEDGQLAAPMAESTTLRTVVLVILIGIFLLFLFGR